MKKSIQIPMSENDLEELRSGEVFNWTFDGVDVEIGLEACCDHCGEPMLQYESIETEDNEVLCYGCDSKRLAEINK